MTKLAKLSCMEATLGIAARFMFALHGILGVILAVFVTDNYWYFFLAAIILLVIAEGVFTIRIFKKKWNWALPCIFIYLCMVVPALLLVEHKLELDSKQMIAVKLSENLKMSEKGAVETNHTDGIQPKEIHNITVSENSKVKSKHTAENNHRAESNHIADSNHTIESNPSADSNHTGESNHTSKSDRTSENNHTSESNHTSDMNHTAEMNHTTESTYIADSNHKAESNHTVVINRTRRTSESNHTVESNQTSESYYQAAEALVKHGFYRVYSNFCPEKSGCNWENTVQVYKQSFIFVLIIGCWLDPMTILNKEEKSQLLLNNIGIAADVLEFLEMAKEVRIPETLDSALMKATFLLPTTLGVWTWSLLQFTIIFKPNHLRRAITLGPAFLERRLFANPACWEVIITLMLMDVPYLVFRLLMIFYFGVVNNSIIFFASKNTLMIIMQFYRIFAVQIEARAELLRGEAVGNWNRIVKTPKTSIAKRISESQRDADQSDQETPEILLKDDMSSSSDGNREPSTAKKRITGLISRVTSADISDASQNDTTLTQILTDDTRSINSNDDDTNDNTS